MNPDIIVCIITSLLNIFFIPFGILLYKNRNVHPIKGRNWELVLIQDFSLLLAGWLESLTFALPTRPCIFDLIGTVFVLWTLAVYVVRLLKLLFAYKIRSSLSQQNPEVTWYLNHRWMVNKKTIAIFLTCYAIFIMIFFFIIFVSLEPSIAGWYACPLETFGYQFSNGFFYLNGCVGTLTAITLFCKLHYTKNYDALKMKREHQFIVIAVLIALICGIFFAALDVQTGYCPLTNLLVGVFLFWTIAWPYFLSRKETKTYKRESSARIKDLNWVLSNPQGLTAFREYLDLEFSSENLTFWLACQQIKTAPLSQLKTQAIGIYVTYVAKNSPYQVNLPSSVINQLENEITKLKADEIPLESIPAMFSAAQNEIFILMVSDSFVRFQRLGGEWIRDGRDGRGDEGEGEGEGGDEVDEDDGEEQVPLKRELTVSTGSQTDLRPSSESSLKIESPRNVPSTPVVLMDEALPQA